MILNIGGGGGVKPRIVVTAPTGSDVTVSKGTTILYAPEVSGTWTFNVPEQGDWSATAILGSKTASKVVSVGKVGVYSVTLRYVSATLNDNSWEDIKGVADVSEGQNYWAVGDTKQITINGKLSDGLTLSNYSTYVYIIGFDHNASVEGTGIAFQGFKTVQTGGIDVALCDSGYNSTKTSGQWFNMNNANSTAGGWASSRMRTTTLPVVKAALPSDLTAALKTTTVYSDNTGGGSDTASYVTATKDDLYLLAEYEIFGSRTYANSAEHNYQQQYAYYAAGNSKVKYRHDSTATAVYWWERSVFATSTVHFCVVGTNGAVSRGYAYDSYGLAPAFKVGTTPPQPISNLAIGSSVFCNVGGVKTEFIVVHQGKPSDMYDDSCNGSWLLMKDVYENRQWNSSNYNSYKASTIHSYLNGTFLNLLNINESIKQVKIPYVNGAGGSAVASGANGLSAKVFLLSGYEVGVGGASYVPQDGAKLDYFNQNTGIDTKRIAYLFGSATPWWLRSPSTGSNENALRVFDTGGWGDIGTLGVWGIRPAFIVPPDTIVSGDGTIQA